MGKILQTKPQKIQQTSIIIGIKEYEYVKFIPFDIINFQNFELIKCKLEAIYLKEDVKSMQNEIENADIIYLEIPLSVIEFLRREKDLLQEIVVEIYKDRINEDEDEFIILFSSKYSIKVKYT